MAAEIPEKIPQKSEIVLSVLIFTEIELNVSYAPPDYNETDYIDCIAFNPG